MTAKTVDVDRCVSYAEGYFSDLMSDASFWPIRVRDLGESFYDHWTLDEPDGSGWLAMAEAGLYDLRLDPASSGSEREPFVRSPPDKADRPSPLPLTQIPQETLELWNTCGKHPWLNPLLKARLADLLRVRGHGDPTSHSSDAVCAYLEIADLHQVDTTERLAGLLRAYELSCRDEHIEQRDQVVSRIESFLDEYPDAAVASGFEHIESLADLRLRDFSRP